jgi:hypothetical protein
MKNIKLYIGLLSVALISLSSCKNDLNVLAPGDEAVSVYGVLDPNEPIQKIRINKVYLTTGDAIAAGQDVDQINYGPNELKVTLQRFMTGGTTPTLTTVGNNFKKEIVLTETVVTTADGGFNVNQRIWQTTDKLFNSGEYKLTITNVSSGKEFTSQTLMIDSVRSYGSMPFIYYPNINPQQAFPVHCGSGSGGYIASPAPVTTQQSAFVDYHVLTATPKIRFKSVANAKLYKVIMRFHYIDSLTDGVTGYRRYVDLNFPSQSSPTLAGGEAMEVSFYTPDFYSNLANQIPKQTVGSIRNRTAHYMEYIITACDENMHTFLQVNQPSNSIAQNKPYYTNINGGVGIFGATSKTTMGKELWYEFINEIADNPATNSLSFVKRYTFVCP